MSAPSSVRFERVSKAYGAVVAVREVSFEIEAGHLVTLLGPSGCGKTTTLRMIAGLELPTSGRILIGAQDVTDLPATARDVAMVFQSYALFPHLSVRENVLFGLKARSVAKPDQERRLERAVEILGIGALLARKPGQLSGGQQQRVALGRAIVAEAPVCLMDEPLSNLDAQLRAEMRREILDLQRRLGITMLYVTHDQTEAMAMADQVVLLRTGRIEQDAPPAEVYAHPATGFAASFIGTPPMNLLPLAPGAGGMVIAGTDGPVICPRTDRALLAGIRPESLHLAEAGIAVVVGHAEYLGADTVVACTAGGTRLLARLPGRADLPDGARAHLAFAPDALHLFDAQTQTRIP